MVIPETLDTDRLRMRIPCVTDAEAIFTEYAQDPEVTRYLIWKPHQSMEETNAFLEHTLANWKDGVRYDWVIERKGDEQLLGMIGVRFDGNGANSGYVLAPAYWGKGYMTEALRGMLEFALSQSGIRHFWAVCDVDNLASARVMEKAGMQREGVLRKYIVHPNVSSEPRDCLCYSAVR